MFDEQDDFSALDDLLAQRGEDPAARRRVARAAASGVQQVKPPGLYGQPVQVLPSVGFALSARRLPDPKARGSIVCVRVGRREVSAMGRQGFFTAWEDGKFLEMPPDLLARVQGGKYDPALARRVASLDEVVGREFALSAASPQELIHKATRDLWAFQNVGGQFQLCRLFDYDGNPLHV